MWEFFFFFMWGKVWFFVFCCIFFFLSRQLIWRSGFWIGLLSIAYRLWCLLVQSCDIYQFDSLPLLDRNEGFLWALFPLFQWLDHWSHLVKYVIHQWQYNAVSNTVVNDLSRCLAKCWEFSYKWLTLQLFHNFLEAGNSFQEFLFSCCLSSWYVVSTGTNLWCVAWIRWFFLLMVFFDPFLVSFVILWSYLLFVINILLDRFFNFHIYVAILIERRFSRARNKY